MDILSMGQRERLAKLTEEAGEVNQAVGKVLLHGYDQTKYLGVKYDNKLSLENELGDLLAIMHLMMAAGDVSVGNIIDRRDKKIVILKSKLKHQ